MMVCLPCPPPVCTDPPKKEKKGPVGLITSCKDKDLIGGKFIGQCTCGMRNGLSPDECPRISCINNPGCWAKPKPLCWPQYQEEPEPAPTPKQELICIPIELHFQPTLSPDNRS